MKRLFKNKKAVSPVIATVLMILVTMAGMTILFAFVSSYSVSYKEGIGGSVMESLTIEDVWISDRTVHVSVYNVATKANLGTDVYLNVATIYVDSLALINPANPVPDSINFYNKAEPVEAGEHMVFIGRLPPTIPIPLVPGLHDITIVTYRGSNFKDQFKVP